MGNRILVDTDFIFALNIENDYHHKAANKKIAKFDKDSLFITSFTIPEAATVISYKISQAHARTFLNQARESQFHIIQLDEVLIQKTDQIFLSQKKKGTSWIDCLNAATVQIHGLDGILSFDSFYKKLGIKMY